MNEHPKTSDSIGLEILPRESAGPEFAERVLDRLETRRRRRLIARTALGIALFAGVGFVLLSGPGGPLGTAPLETGPADPPRGTQAAATDDPVRPAASEARRLRAEAAELERELGDLRRLAQRPTRLYLGGSERLDLTIDLQEIVRARRSLAERSVDRSALRGDSGLPAGLDPVRLESTPLERGL